VKIASVAEVKAQFSAYLKESEQGLVIVTRNGRPVAALLAVRDDEELERLVLAHSPRLQSILKTARQQIREGEGIRHEDFWREMDEEPGQDKKRSKGKKKTV
jgi:prevent-host-death family protein